MEQRESPSESPNGSASQPPPWMHRAASYAPGRRARMLEHMARVRSAPQPQTSAAPGPSRKSGADILGELIAHVVLFGVIAILCMSRIPLYLGAFLFLSDDERIENAFAAIGIRFEPDTIGPDILKGSLSWFGWIALLASLRGAAPVWLAPWLPPSDSWAFIAAIALGFAIIEAFASLAMRRAQLRFGWEVKLDSLTWTTIKFLIAIGVLVLVVLLGTV